jgi:general secretion pathway protein I
MLRQKGDDMQQGIVVPRQQGFNLIEIMFALLLLALVITVSVETSSGDFASYNRIKDTTLARWLASNRIAEAQAGKDFPSLGKQQGNGDMGGIAWQWEQEVSATQDAGLRKIKVSVFHEGKKQQAMAVEVGYVANSSSITSTAATQ